MMKRSSVLRFIVVFRMILHEMGEVTCFLTQVGFKIERKHSTATTVSVKERNNKERQETGTAYGQNNSTITASTMSCKDGR